MLPAPDPQGNTICVFHFPPGITLIDGTCEYVDFAGRTTTHINIGTSCVQYCAYHDDYINLNPSLTAFAFVVMPDFTQNAGCQAGCGSGARSSLRLLSEIRDSVTAQSSPRGCAAARSAGGS